jgi:hypothetical protein
MIACDRPTAVTPWRAERTLGAREVTLLLTRCDGTVDMALESGVGDVAELVVGLDVLLDGLTAVERRVSVNALELFEAEA